MIDIKFISDDKRLDASMFIHMANQVWPGEYNMQCTQEALKKTINVTAWDNGILIGCVRVLSDGYFFGDNNRNTDIAKLSTARRG